MPKLKLIKNKFFSVNDMNRYLCRTAARRSWSNSSIMRCVRTSKLPLDSRRSTRACMSFDENFKHCTGRAEEDSEDDEETELQQRYKQLREQRGTRALTSRTPVPGSPFEALETQKACKLGRKSQLQQAETPQGRVDAECGVSCGVHFVEVSCVFNLHPTVRAGVCVPARTRSSGASRACKVRGGLCTQPTRAGRSWDQGAWSTRPSCSRSRHSGMDALRRSRTPHATPFGCARCSPSSPSRRRRTR
ncbi:hypothetical protein C8Q76DRAFT_629 [Earliella scabrosa]|nr:hypothetical protein C8Q76DRAFT_629 [Earliella scabrosa]